MGRRSKENFSVDYLLPIRINGDWVGIVFRNGKPSQGLMDCYDITNKAILCDPTFDEQNLKWFTNTHRRLRILNDDESHDDDDRKSPFLSSITDSNSMYSPSPYVSPMPSVSNVSQASMPSVIPSLSSSIGGSSFDSGIPIFLPAPSPPPPQPVYHVMAREEQQRILLSVGLTAWIPPSPTELDIPSQFRYV